MDTPSSTLIAELVEALQHAVHWHDQLTPADIARFKSVIAKATNHTSFTEEKS